jgi:fluoride exporter
MTYFFIALGGALGSCARYWCSVVIAARLGNEFPYGTLAVNFIGSFVIGFAFVLLEPGNRWANAAATRDFIAQFFLIGVLGGFTTFSSFSMQTWNLLRAQQWWLASANIVLSVLLCLAAVALGAWLATRVQAA